MNEESGKEMNKQLARITDARFSFEDIGVLILNLNVEYEGIGNQNIAGHVLSQYCNEKTKQVGTAAGTQYIIELLKCLSINDLRDAEGMIVWVYGDGEGWDFKPKGISKLKMDGGKEPFIFNSVFKGA